jgi:Uma2 family endonuclease
MIAHLMGPQTRPWTKDEFHHLGELEFFKGQKVELWEGEIWVQYPNAEPRPRRWTKEEYYRLGELGFFEGQKVELWDGEIVVMSPQKPLHYSVTERVAGMLERHFGAGFHSRMQGPLDVGGDTDPEPDIAVVPDGDYSAAHPRGALLIVEISDTTLATDRGRKASLYAHGAITDYWIVNLVDRQLEVYRNPQPDPAQLYGHGYAEQAIFQPSATVSPLAAPHVAILVADLLG